MTTTTFQEPEITTKNLGELVLWHEQVFDYIRFRTLPGMNPQSLDDFYKEIKFIPDFYSVHLVELDGKELQVFAFTNVRENEGSIVNKMVYINLEKKYSNEIEATINSFIHNYISERFTNALNYTDRFSQTAVNVELLFRKKSLEIMIKPFQEFVKRAKDIINKK